MELLRKDKIKVFPITQENKVEIQKINLFRAKAGFPSLAMDYVQDAIDLNCILIKHPSSTFLVEVEGNSMIEAFISDPCYILVDRSLQPKNNDIVLASINGEFTVKYYQRRGDKVKLIPGNPAYKPTEIVDGTEYQLKMDEEGHWDADGLPEDVSRHIGDIVERHDL